MLHSAYDKCPEVGAVVYFRRWNSQRDLVWHRAVVIERLTEAHGICETRFGAMQIHHSVMFTKGRAMLDRDARKAVRARAQRIIERIKQGAMSAGKVD